ncbi:hypothetical protein FRX31_022385 [Thalictrum thalictroides]|uniref:Protein kinase domain-containing protein n=1 Tax=Thalictrum thalictroides TaxID=46969 RepID=A0A7J6VV29_THATH|nr:hypothetical protein FRX31_022385 [Thalictrum thalictroides]
MWSCFRSPKTHEHPEEEEEGFVVNGALLLQELIASCDAKSNPIRIFSAKELKQATDNYNQSRVFRDKYNYILYRGLIENERSVLVKKFGEDDDLYIQQAINEITIASQSPIFTWQAPNPSSIVTGRYTDKCDVFSFGAVLFEILTGNTASDILQAISSQFNAQTVLSPQMVTELYLNANIFQTQEKPEQVKACSSLALRCVKEKPEERPTMKQVTQELRQIKSHYFNNEMTTTVSYTENG